MTPVASVVHLRYATEPHSPARGVSPLQYASLTETLTAHLEPSPGYEAGGAVAQRIAIPESHTPLADLTEAIRTVKGRNPATRDRGGRMGRQGRQAARRLWGLTIQPVAAVVGEERAARDARLRAPGRHGGPRGESTRGWRAGEGRYRAAGRLVVDRMGPCRVIPWGAHGRLSPYRRVSFAGPHVSLALIPAGDPDALDYPNAINERDRTRPNLGGRYRDPCRPRGASGAADALMPCSPPARSNAVGSRHRRRVVNGSALGDAINAPSEWDGCQVINPTANASGTRTTPPRAVRRALAGSDSRRHRI